MNYMNDNISGCGTFKTFGQAVTMGLMPGYSSLDKYGVNPLITTSSDPEDIWEAGGSYIYDANDTAPIKYICSTSTSDVGNLISVQGLDINGNEVTQTVTLNGQTNVALDTPLWRVYRMGNESPTGGELVGIVSVHTSVSVTAGSPPSNTVRAIINGINGQTLMALYTVPKGKVAFLQRGEIGVSLEGNAASLAEYAHCHYESRRYGKTFRVKKSITTMIGGNSVYADTRSLPDIIPALTDIKLRVIEVTASMGLWGTFDLILVDENMFSKKYLKAIGQPGY